MVYNKTQNKKNMDALAAIMAIKTEASIIYQELSKLEQTDIKEHGNMMSDKNKDDRYDYYRSETKALLTKIRSFNVN